MSRVEGKFLTGQNPFPFKWSRLVIPDGKAIAECERPSLKFSAVGEWIKAIFAGRVEVERIACVGEPGATWRLTWHESVWEVTCASTWIGAIQGAFPGFSVSLVAFAIKFTFVFVFVSEICYHMLTNVVCVFSTSRRPWSWVVLSRCTNGPLARCGFRPGCAPSFALFFVQFTAEFFHTGCRHFVLISRGLFICIRSGCTFPSLLSIGFFFAGFFLPGNAHQYSRVRPTGDVAPQPPIFSSVSINEFFNKAFVWFVVCLVIS